MSKGKGNSEISAVNFSEQFASDCNLRTKVFKKLKEHLLQGSSLDCFGPMSEETIYESMKTYPQEWPIREFEQTVRKAKDNWERIGRRQAEGTCLGNSRSWYYNMSNRYGWSDKSKIETTGSQSLTVSIVDYASSKQADDSV